MMPCALPANHHSRDRVKVHSGSTTPTILCGYHASPAWIATALAHANTPTLEALIMPHSEDRPITKWTVKALTRQCVAELDEKYELVYASYDDRFTNEQVAALIRREDDWMETSGLNDWEGESQYYYAKEYAEDLAKTIAQRWERTFDIDSDLLYFEWERSDGHEELIDEIRDRDNSNWVSQMASNTGTVLMRHVIVDEDDPWSYEPVTATDVIKRFIEHAEPGTVFKRNKHNYKVVRDVLRECSPEYGYLMGMIVYAVNVEAIYNMPWDTEYVDIVNPHLYLGNYAMGDGMCDGPLDATIRVRREDMRTDRDAPGYGWDEVAGVVTSYYETEIRAVPVEKPVERDPQVTVMARVGDNGTFGDNYKIAEAWTVRVGGVANGLRVVRGQSPTPYLTVVDEAGKMLTSWHSGIEPRDLARQITNRLQGGEL